MTDLSMPAPVRGTLPARRLIAAGFIRRLAGRTITVRATQAGVPGTISPATAARVAELHRQAREDYKSSADRRVQHHRDDAHLIADAVEAVYGR